jgi:hypothetical protein
MDPIDNVVTALRWVTAQCFLFQYLLVLCSDQWSGVVGSQHGAFTYPPGFINRWTMSQTGHAITSGLMFLPVFNSYRIAIGFCFVFFSLIIRFSFLPGLPRSLGQIFMLITLTRLFLRIGNGLFPISLFFFYSNFIIFFESYLLWATFKSF